MKEIFIDSTLNQEGLSLLRKKMIKTIPLTIAVIAHDSTKDILAKFISDHIDFFRKHTLISTSETAKIIRSHVEIEIATIGHGPDGGDIILANMILKKECQLLLFFRNGNEIIAHEDDVRALLRITNVTNCVVAQNLATAELVLLGLKVML